MSSATRVPETRELEGDDAVETLRSTGIGELLRDSFVRFRYADGFSHSRALAFQLVLTFFPGLIAVVALARAVGQETVSRVITDTVREIAPGPAGEIVTQAFQQGSQASGSASALIAGLGVTLVAATTAIGQVERGSNRIYGVERDRPSIRKYLRAAALALSAGLLTALAFVLLVPGQALGDALADATGWGDALDAVWTIGRWPLGALLVAAGVTLLYRLSPNRHQPEESWLAFGTGVSVVLWFAFTGLLALYLSEVKEFGETYGPLAGVIGILIWSLLTAIALFGGLAVAAQLEAVRAGARDPRAGG